MLVGGQELTGVQILVLILPFWHDNATHQRSPDLERASLNPGDVQEVDWTSFLIFSVQGVDDLITVAHQRSCSFVHWTLYNMSLRPSWIHWPSDVDSMDPITTKS